MCCAVIGPPIGGDDRMRQLMLDEIDALTKHFIKDGARHRPEAMTSHDIFGVSHAAQCGVDGVFAHTASVGADAGENELAMAGHGFELLEY